jgi:hypothetical protein
VIVGSVSAGVGAWWGAAQLASLAAPPATPLVLAGGVVLVACGSVLGYWAAPADPAPLLERLRKDPAWVEDEKRRLIEAIEDQLGASIQHMTRRVDETGAVIYYPATALGATPVLVPVVAHNKRESFRGLTRFEKWQGCVGEAWGFGEQRVADLASVSDGMLRRQWKMRPDQIASTKHLKAVVSTPIWDSGDPKSLIGMVSFDSTVSAVRSGLTSPASLEEAARCAALLARIVSRSPLELVDLL